MDGERQADRPLFVHYITSCSDQRFCHNKMFFVFWLKTQRQNDVKQHQSLVHFLFYKLFFILSFCLKWLFFLSSDPPRLPSTGETLKTTMIQLPLKKQRFYASPVSLIYEIRLVGLVKERVIESHDVSNLTGLNQQINNHERPDQPISIRSSAATDRHLTIV